jgi:hypothetical protein
MTPTELLRFLAGAAWIASLLTLAACGSASRVTFLRAPAGSVWQVFEVSPAPGSQPRARVTDIEGLLAYAAERSGRFIAIATSSRGRGLEVRDEEGILISLPHVKAHGLDWTADGRRLAFEHEGSIWVVSVDGGVFQMTPDPEPARIEAMFAARPRWSATGDRIFFVRYRTSLDGGGHPITIDHQICSVPANGGEPQVLYSGAPAPSLLTLAVSRDDASVVFDSAGRSGPVLIRLDLATGLASPLVSEGAPVAGAQPSFNAAGDSLAYVHAGQVWLCRYSGSTCTGARQLTDGDHDHTPEWAER